MAEISATDAARNFADLLDAVEHRGEHFTITRRGRIVAQLEPVRAGRGVDVKRLLAAHPPDDDWVVDLASLRALAVPQDRT